MSDTKIKMGDVINSPVVVADRISGDVKQKLQVALPEKNKWPTDISDEQYIQLQEAMAAFFESDFADKITRGVSKQIENSLKEKKKTGWEKMREVLSDTANATAIAGAFTAFIAKHGETVATWVKGLFKV